MEAVTLQEVESRLEAWGEWQCRYADSGLGYPSCSVEGRLARDGMLAHSDGKRAQPIPVESGAEMMDRMVARLGSVHQAWPMMLRKRYAAQLTYAQIARELGETENLVKKQWMPHAKHRLAGYLDAAHFFRW